MIYLILTQGNIKRVLNELIPAVTEDGGEIRLNARNNVSKREKIFSHSFRHRLNFNNWRCMQETKENPFVLVDLSDGHLKSRQLLKMLCTKCTEGQGVSKPKKLFHSVGGGNCCQV